MRLAVLFGAEKPTQEGFELLGYNSCMNTQINTNEYEKLVVTLYELIQEEIKHTSDVEAQYPKLIVMYEFFRLLRGEAFVELREHDPELQKKMYEMENILFEKIKQIKETIPANSTKAKYLYDNMISIGLRI